MHVARWRGGRYESWRIALTDESGRECLDRAELGVFRSEVRSKEKKRSRGKIHRVAASGCHPNWLQHRCKASRHQGIRAHRCPASSSTLCNTLTIIPIDLLEYAQVMAMSSRLLGDIDNGHVERIIHDFKSLPTKQARKAVYEPLTRAPASLTIC